MKTIKYVILLNDLFSESANLYAEQASLNKNSNDTQYVFKTIKHVPDPEAMKNLIETSLLAGNDLQLYVMFASGELKHITDYNKVYGKWEDLYKISLEKYKSSIIDTNKLFVDLNNTKTNLSSNKEIAEENKLEYVQTCMRLTALYDIDDTILDRIKDDNQVQDTIIEAIKAEREENEDDITNEMDIVESTIKKVFPKDYEKLEITKCQYNGEEISHEEMVMKLASHVLPQFITQIDITETLEDSYEIETNLGKIVRSPGGTISILENDK